MLRRKDISNDLREAIVAAINLGTVTRPFQNNLKSIIYSEEEHSQVENIQNTHQSSHEWTSQRGHPNKFTPRSDHEILRLQTAQKLHLRIYRPQLTC